MMKLLHRPKPLRLHTELAALLCLILAVGAFCRWFSPIITPKRHDYGAVWGMYLREPENSIDVLFLGSSLAYCDIVPALLYEDTGISSFVMAGPAQTLPVTYRYLRECCKTQSPGTVFIEFSQAAGMFDGKEAQFLKANLTYMPYNAERLIPVLQETAGQERIGLLFPPYAYHDRWDKLSPEDWQAYETDPLAGYTFLDEVRPAEGFTRQEVAGSFVQGAGGYPRNLEYARKILDFCRERDIRPVFYLTPAVRRFSPEWKAQVAADLAGMGAELFDLNEAFEEIGLDPSLDFYDPSHLNYRGAVKFSHWLAGRLADPVTPSAAVDAALWESRAGHFRQLCQAADEAPVRYLESGPEGAPG